jgi:hypothetical protein
VLYRQILEHWATAALDQVDTQAIVSISTV